jgi:hypothetical protein
MDVPLIDCKFNAKNMTLDHGFCTRFSVKPIFPVPMSGLIQSSSCGCVLKYNINIPNFLNMDTHFEIHWVLGY